MGAAAVTARGAAQVLGLDDLNFIEREVLAFAYSEEFASADPNEWAMAVMQRAMARVTPFLLERRERLGTAQRAGQGG
jgi:hypothetical protein